MTLSNFSDESLPVSSSTESVEEQADLDIDAVQEDVDSQEEESGSGLIFQAIGIIKGEVFLGQDGKNFISIGGRKYSLLYSPPKRMVFSSLLKEIESTGDYFQRLIVYPRVIHFPKRDVPHVVTFQLVGFDKGREVDNVSEELKDFEFKISGLWQFIPVCRVPCISVFRNFSRERLEHIKQSESLNKVRYMKPSHVPLLWKDAPVKPFRFNPKLGKEQGHPYFVSVKARFLPQRDVFGFGELLCEPEEKAPRFLKASKKDKLIAFQSINGLSGNNEIGDSDKKVIKKEKPSPPKKKPKSVE